MLLSYWHGIHPVTYCNKHAVTNTYAEGLQAIFQMSMMGKRQHVKKDEAVSARATRKQDLVWLLKPKYLLAEYRCRHTSNTYGDVVWKRYRRPC